MTRETYGELLFKGVDGSSGSYVYTPWIECRGDAAVFSINIIRITSSLTLSWNVETKSLEQDDSLATALMGSDQAETSAGTKYSGGGTTIALAECRELYRFRFSTGSGYSVSEFVNFRDLDPSWLPN